MAKPLTVIFRGETLNLDLAKVDRDKLYGYSDVEVVDDAGKPCELATLISDGHSIVGKGGTALAYLTEDGLWRKKAELKAVDLENNPLVPVKSTFDQPVTLEATATLDEYLLHNIHALYHLTPDETSEPLQEALASGTIFSFPFSYRGGLEASAGFLLQGADGNPFLCVGARTDAEFIGLEEAAPAVADTDEPLGDDDDILDFSAM